MSKRGILAHPSSPQQERRGTSIFLLLLRFPPSVALCGKSEVRTRRSLFLFMHLVLLRLPRPNVLFPPSRCCCVFGWCGVLPSPPFGWATREEDKQGVTRFLPQDSPSFLGDTILTKNYSLREWAESPLVFLWIFSRRKREEEEEGTYLRKRRGRDKDSCVCLPKLSFFSFLSSAMSSPYL